MNRLLRAWPAALALSLVSPHLILLADVEPQGTDIEYAEQVPLAAQSLLLDIASINERLVAVGERGHVVFSDDLGQTWKQASVVPTRSTLTTVVAVGDRLFAAGHDTVIVTSGDGGETWTRQYFDTERQQPIMDMWFEESGTGIAVGAYGLMLTTSDGGQNWEDWAVNDQDDAHLNSLLEMPDASLLIAGEAGFSYRSTDAGETWEAMEVPYAGSLFGADLAGDGCALLYGLRGHILRSCDSGVLWDELSTGSENTLAGGTGYAGGVLMVGNTGTIVDYRNGGGLETHVHSSGVDFSGALQLDDGRFVLVGEDGVYFYPETGASSSAGGRE
jgi:photosystem II stability/assembly factor-like uncharacterized protein